MFDKLFHADWSKHDKKRWCAEAAKEVNGWLVEAPRQIDSADAFRLKLFEASAHSGVLAGFDFPIGWPEKYGAKTGFHSFAEALPQLGAREWSQFFDVASQRSEISVTRPFFPARPGGTRRSHLVEGLGLNSADELLRICEIASNASSLFWTLGAKQVGKAAISGWKEIISPAVSSGCSLWPFEGSLKHLSERGGLVIAETYPAAAYHYVGIKFVKSGKRSVEGRRQQSETVFTWAERSNIIFDVVCQSNIESGFEHLGPDGEDAFDALMGLLGMIEVVDGRRPEGTPSNPAILTWEGWILGLQPVSY